MTFVRVEKTVSYDSFLVLSFLSIQLFRTTMLSSLHYCIDLLLFSCLHETLEKIKNRWFMVHWVYYPNLTKKCYRMKYFFIQLCKAYTNNIHDCVNKVVVPVKCKSHVCYFIFWIGKPFSYLLKRSKKVEISYLKGLLVLMSVKGIKIIEKLLLIFRYLSIYSFVGSLWLRVILKLRRPCQL